MTRRTLSRPITTPDAEAIRLLLPSLGQSLHDSALALSRDFTLENIDKFLAQLIGAENSIRHLRRAEAQERMA